MDKNGCTERNRRYMDAWLQIIRSYEHLHGQVASLLQERGLTVPQFEVLSTLASTNCGNQQELADRLRMTKGNLVGLIDRLTERGWVEREQVPGDRRVNRVRITEAGNTFIQAVLPEQAKVVESMLSGLDDAEIETLKALLKKTGQAP
jgi:MarR family transcriptional regulator, organic hydroperoxide resistance regulator